MIRTLCLEGAAAQSTYSVGALEYMLQVGLLSGVRDIYCFSFGSLIAACFCITGSFKHILVEMQRSDVSYECKNIQTRLLPSVLFPFLKKFNTSSLRRIISKVIPENFKTLDDLQKKSGICIHILASQVGAFKTKVFSSQKHPDLCLVTALLASCAVPYIFEPVMIHEKLYIDGQINNNFHSIRINGKKGEILEITSAKPACRFVGLNIYQSLWRHALAIQAQRTMYKQVLKMPSYQDMMIYISTEQMKKMFYTGALIASCEYNIHHNNFPLPAARMACCGISAATVAHEFPTTPYLEKLAEWISNLGITVIPNKSKFSKVVMCECGNELQW